jgi:acetyltransferase EpsM
MTRGGQGRVVMDTCLAAGHNVVGILDDSPDGPGEYNGIPVLGKPSSWRTIHLDAGFALAIDQRQRIELGRQMFAAGRILPAVVHPAAFVSPSATIAAGTIVMSNCTVNANANIGAFVIINANCSVDHDCVVGTASQLGPGVVFPGNVQAGEGAFIGAGAISLPGRTIGAWATIGAGAVLTKDVSAGGTAIGNPARILEPRTG